MPVDTDVVNSWFDGYFGTFEACARGGCDMSELLRHYGVPLIFTSDAGVTTLMTDDEAAAVMQGLIDGLRANGYHHTDVLHPEVSVLNLEQALAARGHDRVATQADWLSTAQAAKLLGVSDRTARRIAKRIGRRVGRDWIIDADALPREEDEVA
jgi:Helix-turn-helix domain